MRQILSQMPRVREPRKDRPASFLNAYFWAFSLPVSMLVNPQFWVLLGQHLGVELLSIFFWVCITPLYRVLAESVSTHFQIEVTSRINVPLLVCD